MLFINKIIINIRIDAEQRLIVFGDTFDNKKKDTKELRKKYLKA